MMDPKTKSVINDIGDKLALQLPGFYGKITFCYQNGKCGHCIVEQNLKRNTLKEGDQNG